MVGGLTHPGGERPRDLGLLRPLSPHPPAHRLFPGRPQPLGGPKDQVWGSWAHRGRAVCTQPVHFLGLQTLGVRGVSAGHKLKTPAPFWVAWDHRWSVASCDVTAPGRRHWTRAGRGVQDAGNPEPRCESGQARFSQLYLDSEAGSFWITRWAFRWPLPTRHTVEAFVNISSYSLIFFPLLLLGLLNFFLFLASPLLSLQCSLFSTLFIILGLCVTITFAFPLQLSVPL